MWNHLYSQGCTRPHRTRGSLATFPETTPGVARGACPSGTQTKSSHRHCKPVCRRSDSSLPSPPAPPSSAWSWSSNVARWRTPMKAWWPMCKWDSKKKDKIERTARRLVILRFNDSFLHFLFSACHVKNFFHSNDILTFPFFKFLTYSKSKIHTALLQLITNCRVTNKSSRIDEPRFKCQLLVQQEFRVWRSLVDKGYCAVQLRNFCSCLHGPTSPVYVMMFVVKIRCQCCTCFFF